MKFYRTNLRKPAQFSLPRSPQRMAAARRAVQKEREKFALLPELVTHQTAEERVAATEAGLRQAHIDQRLARAHDWRRARRRLNTLPHLTRLGALRYWNSDAWLPREPSYLLDLIHGILQRGENPWTQLRTRRQFQLIGQGRLPRTLLRNRPGILLKPRNPFYWVRIRDRIAARTSLRGIALYSIIIS